MTNPILGYNGKPLIWFLLSNIRANLQQVKQWQNYPSLDHAQHYASSMAGLQILVKTLEWFDCGSVGGYGEGQGFKKGDWQCNANHNSGDLFDRAKWLLKKYDPKGKTRR